MILKSAASLRKNRRPMDKSYHSDQYGHLPEVKKEKSSALARSCYQQQCLIGISLGLTPD
jgi:hypothetical protein